MYVESGVGGSRFVQVPCEYGGLLGGGYSESVVMES